VRSRAFARAATLSLTIGLFLAASPSPAQDAAATPTPVDAEGERRRDLERMRRKIATLQASLAESEKKAATLAEEVRRLELSLEIAERELELTTAVRRDLSIRLESTRKESEAAGEAVAASRRALASRARVLHRFGRFGYLRVLLEARDVPALLDAVDRLDALARRDGRLLSAHRTVEKRLAENLARERALKSEIDTSWTASRNETARIARLRRERAALLDRERGLSASSRDQVVALRDKAARLEQLLATLANQSDGLPSGSGGGIRPWKGVLDWPARGPVVETFGRHRHPRFDAWTISNGIGLSLAAGTPVRAVYAGKTVYARWLAEYGNLVIVDHGDGVFSLYAWLQGLSVSQGDYVQAGSVVGSAGIGPGREEAGLYFELRDHQKAADPVAWLR
jgi:septal ring factor EnvC (AmiA/AmiB activator)